MEFMINIPNGEKNKVIITRNDAFDSKNGEKMFCKPVKFK